MDKKIKELEFKFYDLVGIDMMPDKDEVIILDAFHNEGSKVSKAVRWMLEGFVEHNPVKFLKGLYFTIHRLV